MANFKALDHGGPVNCNKTQSLTEYGFDQGMSLIKPRMGLIRKQKYGYPITIVDSS